MARKQFITQFDCPDTPSMRHRTLEEAFTRIGKHLATLTGLDKNVGWAIIDGEDRGIIDSSENFSGNPEDLLPIEDNPPIETSSTLP